MTLPTQARIVVVGAGIAGCSTAYHLAKLGRGGMGSVWLAERRDGQPRRKVALSSPHRLGPGACRTPGARA